MSDGPSGRRRSSRRSACSFLARRLTGLLGVLTVLSAVTVLSPTGVLTPAVASARATPVTMTVLSVSPSTPAIAAKPAGLQITVALTNTTASVMTGIRIVAERGDPIGNQAALNASLASTAARTGGRSIEPVKPATLTLPPSATVKATFTTTTSTVSEGNTGICLCTAAMVYPIDLTAQATVDGAADVLGGTRTYLPSFDAAPAHKLGVTWVWPLIDRPHRSTDGKVFTDDDLALSVASGRLDRALQVIEDVGAAPEQATAPVTLTLVVDPDLLDELQVMASGPYSVRAADGTVRPGTGQQAAAAWLARLRAVLTSPTQPQPDLTFTPLGDPDVTGLSQHDETWSATPNATITNRVTTALGGVVPMHPLAWPPSNSATVGTLDRLIAGGANTVLLDSARVRPSTSGAIPLSAARLRTTGTPVKAMLTSPALQRYAAAALAGSAQAMPALTAELAVRVAQRPTTAQYAVLAAPRYVDPPSPTTAANTILRTSNSAFSQPVTSETVTGSATVTASVRKPVTSPTGLSAEQLESLHAVTGYLKPVTAMIAGPKASTAARSLLTSLPDVIQRNESGAWSSAGAAAGVGGGPTAGAVRTAALSAQLSGYLGQVRILNRSMSSYTLASSNSPLPVTIVNNSPFNASLVVSVSAAGGLPGFAKRQVTVVVGANNKYTVKIGTHIERSGRIPIEARLRTPDDYDLGSVQLFVHSTVLGTIGVVITIVAGVVLALALLVRFTRRVLRIRHKRSLPGAPGPTRTGAGVSG